jgi:hypothetical protein
MSSPSIRTSPVARVPGIVSFMRLIVRRKVDLPQPEGPMKAITRRTAMSNEMLKSACAAP